MSIKRAGYVAAGLAAGTLVLLGLPALIQWDSYKGEIIQAMKARLGREVALDGPLNFALLPLPHAKATNVRIANAEGAARPEMLSAASLELRPAFWPLLSGRFELAAVRLSGVELHLQRLAGGKGNWQFEPEAKPAKPEEVTASSAPASDHHERTFPAISLEDALITYQAGNGQPLRLEGVTAALTRSEAGDTTFAARMQARGLPLSLEGKLGNDGEAVVNVALDRQAAELMFQGHFTTQDGFSGKLSAKAQSLRDTAAVFGWTAARLPKGGAELKGDLVMDAHVLHLAHGVIRLAGAEGTATLDADFGHGPQLDAALSFQHVDLDQWAASLPAPTLRQSPPPASVAAPSVAPGIASAPAKVSGGFSKALAVNFDLSIDSLSLHGGELRQARLNAALANGELLVNQAGVELPGDGELNLFGFFTPDGSGLAFDGTLEGRAGDLRGMMSWLALPPVHLAEDRLKKGSFTGHFLADAQSLRIEGGLVRLDGAKADLAADLKLGPRPALGVSFAVDKLDIDAYRAVREPAAKDASASAPKEPKAEGAVPPPADPARDSWLPGVDANIKGKVGALTAYGLSARDLSVDANWLNGVLTLRDLTSPDVNGAEVHLSGGLVPSESAFRQFHWAVHSDHPARLLNGLVSHLPVEPERLGPMALTGSLDGKPAEHLDLDSRNEIAGGQLELVGRIDHALDNPGLHLSLAASHGSLTQVLRLFSPDYHPRDGLGAFAASTKIEGNLDEVLAFQDLRLKLGPAAAAGDAKLTRSGARPRLDVTLTAGEIPLDPFQPTKRTGDIRPPTLREQIQQGLLIPTKGVPANPHWPGDNVQPPAPSAAPRPSVAVGGISEHWSSAPLNLSWLTALDGSVAIESQALTWSQSRLEPASLELALQDGSAKLDHLKGGLWGGEMLLSGVLADNGAAKLEGKLSHVQMKQALLSTAGLGLADGMLEGETSLTAKGKSVAEMISHLNGTAKFQAKDGAIKGFELKAVDDKAKEMNSPLGLIGLLQAGLSGGSTKFSSFSGTAKVKEGIVTSDDLALVADGGGAKGQVSANLPGWVMDAHAAFHLASSPDAPPLVMRLTGALDNPRRFLDINAMQTWLAQKGVGAKGGLKDAGDALAKMISGERKDDGSKVKAKDVVKGLIKGLKK